MRFSNLVFHHRTIILDIDGTLAPAGALDVAPEIAREVARLKADNEILLFSNRRDLARNRALAESLGLPLIESVYRKPDPRVLREQSRTYKDMVVVGDKLLTDGLFAFLTGAEFVHVIRVSGTDVALIDRFADTFDATVSFLWYALYMLRPGQWVKNLLVFAPLFFAHKLFDSTALIHSSVAFIVFCLLASAGYVVNDVFDKEADHSHPRKRFRPVASGKISISSALGLSGVLIAVAFWLIVTYVPSMAVVAALYIFSNIFYSAALKRIPLLEILIFAWFYLARVLAGGYAAGVPISAWLILSVIFLALLLLIAKRYSEQRLERSRPVLAQYPEKFLEGMLFLSAGLVIVSYGLYSILGTASSLEVYSTLPVLAGVMRYLQLVFTRSEVEYPERVVFSDAGLLACVVVWLASMFVLLYH